MIITNNEELLRKQCDDVIDSEVAQIRNALESELRESARLGRPGIGLAAPQIGIYKKMAIVRVAPDLHVDLVNCHISNGYDLSMFRDEGCLSFPGRVENTMRYQEIYVKNNLAGPSSFIATGLFAVCIQHELDHINGILLPDKALKNNIKQKLGPNDPCYCGKINKNTGKVAKYKKCCGQNI